MEVVLSIFVPSVGLDSQRTQLTKSFKEEESHLKEFLAEEEEKREEMEMLVKIRDEKERARRDEVYQLKKFSTEKDNLTARIEKMNNDLESRGIS